MTEDQLKILRFLDRHKSEGAQNTMWIAEGCGHYYDTPWASARLATLKKHGMVENLYRGVWRITDAGLEALRT